MYWTIMYDFQHSITVEPYSVTSGKGRYTSSSVTYNVFVQPLDLEDALQADGVFNRKVKVYAELDCGIKKEDRVTFESQKYKVESVTHYRATERVSHDKIIIVEIDE